VRQWPVSIIAMTAATLALSVCLSFFINRYFPWMTQGIRLPAFFRQRE